MKKFIAIVLTLVMLLGLAACGPVNDAAVAVVWSGDGEVKIPDSLINSMERAMYIESIAYEHYGAKGDAAAQLDLINKALKDGCAAVAVELVEGADAQAVVDAAKAKNVPVVFFNCLVEDAVLASYNKAVLIGTDEETLAKTQGEMIYEYLEANNAKGELDRNEDGKISYVTFGDASAVVESLKAAMNDDDSKKAVKVELTLVETITEELPETEVETDTEAKAEVSVEAKMAELLTQYNDEKKNMVELIITDDEDVALDVLRVLQKNEFNSTKLKTHLIPLFTVGADLDAREFTDTTGMKEEELEVLIFTVRNIIGNGQLAGTVLESQDTIAESVAKVLSNLLRGKEATSGIDEKIVVGGQKVSVPYMAYTA